MKYIEDNDELDAEKVEKVAPYYQKTSVVLAGTQIGYLFCSSIFALSLYQSVRHMVLFWEEIRTALYFHLLQLADQFLI